MRLLSFRSKFVPLKFSNQFIRHNHVATPVPSPSTTQSVQLRDYQEHCIEACLNAINRGVTRIGVSMPTGSGKTTVFVSLLQKLSSPSRPNATKSLIVVNSIELAQQAANQVNKMFPDLKVELEQGKNSATGRADVTVATYQTLLRGNRLLKFSAETTRAVIVDEAHHAAAKSYLSILSHFDPTVGAAGTEAADSEAASIKAKSSSVPIIGFSATFGRHDGRALGVIFQEIVYHRDFLEMIKEQWLCNVRFTTVKANIDLSSVTVSQSSGDFVPSSLAHVMNTDTVNSLVVQSWLDKAANRKSTIVFCANLAHVHDLTTEFRSRGIDARYIHSGTHVRERQQLLEDFRAGLYPVLINCAILTEGADVPNIDCVIVARPTRSRNVFAQMIGRGMRLSPQTGKQDCHILDFVDSHGRVAGMFSTPSLFGLDPNEITPGASLDELLEKKELAQDEWAGSVGPTTHNMPEIKSVTYQEHDDPFSWQHHAKTEKNVRLLSPLAWVASHGSYILETLGRGNLRVEPLITSDQSRTWEVNYIAAWDRKSMAAIIGRPISIAGRTRRIALAANLSDAINAADTFAKQKLAPGQLSKGLLRTAAWRRGPSSEAQREMIAKSLGISLERGSNHVVPEKANMRGWCRIHSREELSRLTKGSAADIITRLRSGAKGKYEKELKKRTREEKEQQKEDARLAREVVKVGPLRAA